MQADITNLVRSLFPLAGNDLISQLATIFSRIDQNTMTIEEALSEISLLPQGNDFLAALKEKNHSKRQLSIPINNSQMGDVSIGNMAGGHIFNNYNLTISNAKDVNDNNNANGINIDFVIYSEGLVIDDIAKILKVIPIYDILSS